MIIHDSKQEKKSTFFLMNLSFIIFMISFLLSIFSNHFNTRLTNTPNCQAVCGIIRAGGRGNNVRLFHIYFLTHSCADPAGRTTEPHFYPLRRIDRLDLKRGDLGAFPENSLSRGGSIDRALSAVDGYLRNGFDRVIRARARTDVHAIREREILACREKFKLGLTAFFEPRENLIAHAAPP